MIIEQCPHCLVKHVQTSREFSSWLHPEAKLVTWCIERCQNSACKRLILIESAIRGEVLRVYPFVQYALGSASEIPDEIRNDFSEAGKCLGAGCFKASLVMSRRVLQRSLETQGCKDRNLVDAIDNAVKNNVLRKAFHPLAHEIRQYGNLGAHPKDDQLQNANKESAEHVLEFARLLIHEFFEVPAVAASLKKNRED